MSSELVHLESAHQDTIKLTKPRQSLATGRLVVHIVVLPCIDHLQAELYRARETALLCGDKALTLSSELVHLKSVHQQLSKTTYAELNAFHTEILPQLNLKIMEVAR